MPVHRVRDDAHGTLIAWDAARARHQLHGVRVTLARKYQGHRPARVCAGKGLHIRWIPRDPSVHAADDLAGHDPRLRRRRVEGHAHDLDLGLRSADHGKDEEDQSHGQGHVVDGARDQHDSPLPRRLSGKGARVVGGHGVGLAHRRFARPDG